jgi:2-polyprenyl-3-methyl-5-hydroxy-6-metoxy-1,4-benzoquinol methylase
MTDQNLAYEFMPCCVCASQKCVDFMSVYDDRYGYPGNFLVVQCLSCGHKQLQAEFTSENLTELYTQYYPRSTFELEQYQPHQESHGFWAWLNGEYCSAFRWVPKNVRVLDIGCGFGESLGYHQARGCDVYGVEADANIRRVAEKYSYKVHVGLFDADLYESDYFDYITADQVIEHITDPAEILSGIARILKPGGKVILSTPNSNSWAAKLFGCYWINWHSPYHLQHFSRQSLQLAAEKAGLILKQTKTITSSEWLYYQWIHLFIFPRMGSPSAFWSRYKIPSLSDKLIIKTLKLIHSTKLNHLISRLFDGFEVGDNYLFMLEKN